MEVTQSTAAGAQASAASASSKKLAENFDTFLSLLTTQLKYQDPLDPMDSSEFVAQLVQFTNVEQAIATNTNLEKLLSMQSANQMVGALGYIGKQVEARSAQLPLRNGEAAFTYTLDANAESAAIVIADRAGNTIYTAPAETAAGKHGFTWRGTDSSGLTVADGAYSVKVVARDKDNAVVGANTAVVATVDGVETTDTGFVLSLGDVKVDLKNVIAVSDKGNGA